MGTAVGANIRIARPEDAAGIARVETETWRDAYPTLLPDGFLVETLGKRARWPGRLRGKVRSVLVAESKPVGIVAYATWGRAVHAAIPGAGQLYELYVDADFRERGLGRNLCCEVAKQAASSGWPALSVEVLDGNPSRFFYEALGARLIARTHHDFGGRRLPSLIYSWDDLTQLANAGAS